MLRFHLLLLYRNMLRSKGQFLINLTGLSSGLTCALLIFLWVNDEWHFDKFHRNDAQLYQVLERSTENGRVIVHETTQGPLAEAMTKDMPEVTAAASVMSLAKDNLFVSLQHGEKAVRSTGIFASRDFFNVFSFPLVSGDPKQALADRNAIVLSEGLARSLFGGPEAAIGKTVAWELFGMKKQSLVSAVFRPLPANNSMAFDFVLTYDLLLSDIWTGGQKWWNEGAQTYLLLKAGTDTAQFNAKIGGFVKRYLPESIFTLFVRPYSSAYLYGKYENGVQAGGRIAYVRLFSLIALFVLLIACINFMNLSTAKATQRLKEVGIKKTVGATRRNLVVQFLSEAIFLSLAALTVAVAATSLLLPAFNGLTGKQLSFDYRPGLLAGALGIALLTGLVSGSYPAFYLSGFKPAAVLKGRLKGALGELLARKGLVVFQFVISLVLMVAVLVVYRQVEYVQSKNLGYDKANVLYFDKAGKASQQPEDFLAALRKVPGVVNASAIQTNIVQNGSGAFTYGIEWPGKTEHDLINFAIRSVDYDLIETLGIPLAGGRSFSRAFGAEDSKVLFNETAIRAMGLNDPVGKSVRLWGEEKTIIGVLRDFHITSLHEPIPPMVFTCQPTRTAMIMAKIEAGREKETIDRLRAFYTTYNPGYPFDFKFLDEDYQAQYVSERRVAMLSRYFAGLAMLISCLGLLGLAAFSAGQRSKEIGIRKVLGASVSGIARLLAADFLKLVVIAIAIATPVAWWSMQQWLADYAYHIKLEAWMFVLAGLGAIGIAVLTVGFQSLKAALANPVTALKSE